MIEPERKQFEEIKERGKRSVFLADDFEWLVTELDSYSQAWKTERENLRKLTDTYMRLIERQEKMIGVLKALINKAEQIADLEYEVRLGKEILNGN